MKQGVLVGLQALLSVGLAAAIVVVKQKPPSVAESIAPAQAVSEPAVIPKNEAPIETENSPKQNKASAGPDFHWSQVESTDYKEYIKKLRATGCPEQTINDIITFELNSLFAARENPLKAKIAAFKARPAGATDVANTKEEFDTRKQLRAVEQEKQNFLKDLLGVEVPLDPIRGWHERAYDRLEASLNTVPADKRERVREIQEQYWEVSDYLNDKYGLKRTPEYLEEYQKINQVRKSLLAKALTPQEMADYEMRTSGIASRLGTQLSGTGVTPDEFRQIFNLQNNLEAPYGGSVRVNETETGQTSQYQQSKADVEQKIAKILGPERYEAYQLAQDSGFKRFSDLGDRYGISRENLVQAYRAQQQLVPTRSPSNATPTQSVEDWQQYQAKMVELLGEPAFRALTRGQNFSSMNSLLFP